MEQPRPEAGGLDRRRFLKRSAGVAAGAAALGAPAAAAARTPQAASVVAKPATEMPAEPVMAYLRSADRGEVTVLHGRREITYRDRVLADRLAAIAPPTSRER